MQQYLIIGEITKPQGVRGELKLRPATGDPGRFEGLTQAYFKRGGEYVSVRFVVNRITRDAVFLSMEGVTDRDQAEKLRGELLYIDRARAVELDEETNFLVDLIGLRGMDDQGRELGRLTDVLQPGGNDVYVFRGPLGEVLIPALKSVVRRVDLAAGTILFDANRLNEVAVFDED